MPPIAVRTIIHECPRFPDSCFWLEVSLHTQHPAPTLPPVLSVPHVLFVPCLNRAPFRSWPFAWVESPTGRGVSINKKVRRRLHPTFGNIPYLGGGPIRRLPSPAAISEDLEAAVRYWEDEYLKIRPWLLNLKPSCDRFEEFSEEIKIEEKTVPLNAVPLRNDCFVLWSACEGLRPH